MIELHRLKYPLLNSDWHITSSVPVIGWSRKLMILEKSGSNRLSRREIKFSYDRDMHVVIS